MNLATTYSIYAGGPGSGCHGDNCGRPKSGLQELLERVGPTWGKNNLWAKLAEHGHPGSTEPFTKDEKKDLAELKQGVPPCKIGFCYMNAQRLALAGLHDSRVQYVEGLVTVHGVPIDHAWIEFNGKVFDPTVMNASGKPKTGAPQGDYFGVTVPKDEIMKFQFKQRTYSPLSHAYDDQALQEKIWK